MALFGWLWREYIILLLTLRRRKAEFIFAVRRVFNCCMSISPADFSGRQADPFFAAARWFIGFWPSALNGRFAFPPFSGADSLDLGVRQKMG